MLCAVRSTLGWVVDSVTVAFRCPDLSLPTLTVALALTGSVVCSGVFLVINLVTDANKKDTAVTRPRDRGRRRQSACHLQSQRGSPSPQLPRRRRIHSIPLIRQDSIPQHGSGRFCSRCNKIEADWRCARNLCRHCCHSDHIRCTFHSNQIEARLDGFTNQVIDLRGQRLTRCPERIGFRGHQVSALILSDNELGCVPEELGCLQGLRTLDLSRNRLMDLPASVGTLGQLSSLCVSHNQLSSLPPSCAKLQHLENLELRHNQLDQLPPAVTQLVTLQSLDLSHNKIETLPENLCNLQNLEDFVVSHNPLVRLPSRLDRLCRLHTLDVTSCHLSQLPAALTSCAALFRLNASYNRLRHLPRGLAEKLMCLQIQHNRLLYLDIALYDLLVTDIIVFTAHNNPFLTKDSSETFLSNSLDKTIPLVPSLQEWCSKVIVSHEKVDWKSSNLPSILKESLSSAHYCHVCGSAVFHFYHCHVEFHSIDHHRDLPFCRVLCPHSNWHQT